MGGGTDLASRPKVGAPRLDQVVVLRVDGAGQAGRDDPLKGAVQAAGIDGGQPLELDLAPGRGRMEEDLEADGALGRH